jgi:hypothetical protein
MRVQFCEFRQWHGLYLLASACPWTYWWASRSWDVILVARRVSSFARTCHHLLWCEMVCECGALYASASCQVPGCELCEAVSPMSLFVTASWSVMRSYTSASNQSTIRWNAMHWCTMLITHLPPHAQHAMVCDEASSQPWGRHWNRWHACDGMSMQWYVYDYMIKIVK